jgi:hypothetical protein
VNLKELIYHDGNIETTSAGWRLTISNGSNRQYRLAQLDNCTQLPRRKFPSHPPLTLSLRVRASSQSIPGTWGFGLWNDPFGLSLGFGGNPFRLPALPNAAWFFHASPQNYLSFREDKPAQGFLAQAFSSPSLHPSLLSIGLTFPFSKKKARRSLSRIIAEDSVTIGGDVSHWHRYRLEWSPNRSAFWVDDAQVLDTPVSPLPPLGLVIWLDNQYAAFTPDGKLKWGLENNLVDAWLEIDNIEFGI